MTDQPTYEELAQKIKDLQHAESGRHLIEETLRRKKIAYLVYPLGEGRINVFFGDDTCIAVIRMFDKHNLFDLTDEEDFILGVMLGYDTAKQCERYLDRKSRTTAKVLQSRAA